MNVEQLQKILEKQYTEEYVTKIMSGYKKTRKTTLRVNTIKSSIEEIKNKLNEANIDYEQVDWSKEAFIIKNADEKIIQEMDIYQNGQIYLQSLSSMLPPIILDPKQGSDILRSERASCRERV